MTFHEKLDKVMDDYKSHVNEELQSKLEAYRKAIEELDAEYDRRADERHRAWKRRLLIDICFLACMVGWIVAQIWTRFSQ